MVSDKHATDATGSVMESGCKCGGRCRRLRGQSIPAEQGAGAEPETHSGMGGEEGQSGTGHRPATGCTGHS